MIYFGLAIILLLCFWIEYNSPNGSSITKVLFGICALLFLALFAFRGINVGGDTIRYVRFYTGSGNDIYGSLTHNTFEIGFVVFCEFLNLFSNSASFFIFCTALFTTIPFVMLINRHSKYKTLSLLYLISSNFAIMIVNIETNIRQNVATAFLMLALIFALEKERVKYWYLYFLPLLVAGILCHTSSYIIVPLAVFFYIIPFNKNVSIFFIILSFLIPLLDATFFNKLFDQSGAYLSGFEHLNNITRHLDASSRGEKNRFILTSIRFTEMAPPTIWAIYNVWSCSKAEANNYFMKNLVVGMIMLNVGVSFFLSFRFAYLFVLIGYCYIPEKFSKNKMAMLINVLIILVLMFRLFTYVTDPTSYNTDAHILPYDFIF